MNNCPCCSEPLLRHIRHGHVYWFCPHCHQEMPNFTVQPVVGVFVNRHWHADHLDEALPRLPVLVR